MVMEPKLEDIESGSKSGSNPEKATNHSNRYMVLLPLIATNIEKVGMAETEGRIWRGKVYSTLMHINDDCGCKSMEMTLCRGD